MDTFDLAVTTRSEQGKKVKRLRHQGQIPIVIYGQKKAPELGQVEGLLFEKLYKNAGESSIVTVTIDGSAQPTLIHDVSWNPVSDRITHADLLRIDLNKEIEATVHLKHVGVAPAVKEFMGVVITVRDTVHIRCLPKDLAHEIEVDLSTLTKIGDTIHIKDLTIPAGVTITDSPEMMLVSMAAPRAEEVAKPVETAEVAAAPVEGAAVPVEGDAVPATEQAEAKKTEGKK